MTSPKRAEPANEHAKRLRALPCNSHWEVKALVDAAVEIERLAALEQDAMRYRFLRSQHWTDGGLVVSNTQWLGVGAIALSRELLDEAIDRQIAAGPVSKPDQETKGER